MLAWLRSPRGSVSTATAVAVVLAALWFVQRTALHRSAPDGPDATMVAQVPAAMPASEPAAGAAQSVPQPQASVAANATAAVRPLLGADGSVATNPTQRSGQGAGQGQIASATAPATLPSRDGAAMGGDAVPVAGAPGVPAFDIVRVEPSGDAVIAGRGEPGSSIDLVDDGAVVAHVTVDPSGQFALLPPRLAEGSHFLTLQVVRPGGTPVVSAQGVAVSIAKGGIDKPLVALLSPDQPARVLSDGGIVAPSSVTAAARPAGANQASDAGQSAGATPVAIQAVEAAQGGQFTASGVARAGNQCRLYLNGAFLADVTTGKDGRWSVRVAKGMRPGKYTVRADEIEASSGKVVNRAEVPFDYPAVADASLNLLAKATPSGVSVPSILGAAKTRPAATKAAPVLTASNATPIAGLQASDGASAPQAGDKANPSAAVIADLQSAKVIRGDSLWRISRKMLGHGVNYTEIYASNASQIRDPRLIYPGQIFVVPNRVN